MDMNSVLCTRIRLSRNIKGLPFPWRLSEMQKKETAAQLVDLLKSGTPAGEMKPVWLHACSREEAYALVENYRIRPESITTEEGHALLSNADGSVTVLIHDEDHLRLQITLPGEQLDAAYHLAVQMDAWLENHLAIAFDDSLGYLTADPRYVGTGMCASLMVHLPVLQENGTMRRTVANLAQLGLTVRGLYGAGSEPTGAIYQIANQVALGLSEQDAIYNLRNLVGQLVKQETAAQKAWIENEPMQDAVLRSFGILKTAKLMKCEECMNLLSNLRIGIRNGLIRGISMQELFVLQQSVQPATLTVQFGVESGIERERCRASIVKEALREAEENDDVPI